MKNLIFLLTISLALLGCRKEEIAGCMDPYSISYDENATVDDGSCIYIGEAVFWTSSAHNHLDVDIYGDQQTITSYFPSSTPSCGEAGCATYALAPGTYFYFIQEQGTSNTWTGNIEIENLMCTSVEIP